MPYSKKKAINIKMVLAVKIGAFDAMDIERSSGSRSDNLEDIELDSLKIVSYPHPVLRKRSVEIDNITSSVRKIAERMIEIMHSGGGVGLAANQVGLSIRIFVANPGEGSSDLVFINPAIVDSTGWIEAEEGCLSLPQIYGNVRRNKKIVVVYRDLTGNEKTLEAEGLLSRVIQHELDHLDGRLIIDRFSPITKMSLKSRLKELERAYRACR